MKVSEKTSITVEATIMSPVEQVWKIWTEPKHITEWNAASTDWHTPKATNDLRVGGRFTSRMEARDGSAGFDFGGVYDVVTPNEYIEYTIDDGRKVSVKFKSKGNETVVSETFEAEAINSVEMQKNGWQAILHSFKKYTESISR